MKLAIAGCTGRMGRELINEALSNHKHSLECALAKQSSDFINKDVGELVGCKPIGKKITHDISGVLEADAIIDFTTPGYSLEICRYAAKNGLVHVIGTTGFFDEELDEIKELSQHTRIFLSYNMCIGINLISKLAQKAAEILRGDYDAEILEMHHKNKVDAPSGTAIMLGKSVASGLNIEFNDENSIFNRKGRVGIRENNKIGFASLRGGSVVGDHKVIFAGTDDIIELSHHAINRSIYAKGAIKAAEWVISQPNGLYNMDDMTKL